MIQLDGTPHTEYIWLPEKTRWLVAHEIETTVPREERTGEQMDIVDNSKPQPIDAILMGLVPNGDLNTLLKKAGSKGLLIPHRVLWSFFLCSKLQHANSTIFLGSFPPLNKRHGADEIYTVVRMCIG